MWVWVVCILVEGSSQLGGGGWTGRWCMIGQQGGLWMLGAAGCQAGEDTSTRTSGTLWPSSRRTDLLLLLPQHSRLGWRWRRVCAGCEEVHIWCTLFCNFQLDCLLWHVKPGRSPCICERPTPRHLNVPNGDAIENKNTP